MNYSWATKRSLDYSKASDEVLNQSVLELKRDLSKAERESLFQNSSPQFIAERIKKVEIF